jgi:hypothetical protein
MEILEILFIVAAVFVLGFFVYIILKGQNSEDEQGIVEAKPVAVVPQEPEAMNKESLEEPVIESSPEEAVEELEKELYESEEDIDEITEEDPLEKL